MTHLRIALGLALAAVFTETAHAAPRPSYSQTYDACMAGAKSTLDMNACNAAELKLRDAALNVAYTKALVRASGAADAFKGAERAWIAYRDADCGVYANREAFGSLGTVEAGTCLIDRTIERTRALEAFRPY